MNKKLEIKNTNKVMTIISQMAKAKTPVLLWQNIMNNERYLIHATVASFNKASEQLTFTPDEGKFLFQSDEKLFVVNPSNSILFKTPIYLNSSNRIITNIPESILLTECRKDKRQNLSHKDISLSYHYGPSTGKRLERFPFTSKIIDYSLGGLSFTSKLKSINTFEVGDHISLKLNDMGNQILDATICYIQATTHQNFRIGVKFIY